MPVHRVSPDGELETAIDKIQRLEHIVAVSPHGDGSLIVITEPKRGQPASGQVETR